MSVGVNTLYKHNNVRCVKKSKPSGNIDLRKPGKTFARRRAATIKKQSLAFPVSLMYYPPMLSVLLIYHHQLLGVMKKTQGSFSKTLVTWLVHFTAQSVNQVKSGSVYNYLSNL